MDLYPLCPFPIGTLIWETQPGQFSLTVTVKATFSLIADGDALIAAKQEPINGDRHWDDNALASLYHPSDHVPLKRRVDICLVGHAWAPRGVPVDELVATLRVGTLYKPIRILGDRVWMQIDGGFVPSPPTPFSRMPLRYERAALSLDNPVGIDLNAPPMLGAAALPNLLPLEPEGAMGFGPVAPTWKARRQMLDDTSLFWAYGLNGPTPRSIGPAPPGLDFEFFNAAPRDQQIELLRTGTEIELENLNPEHPRLHSRLPMMRPQVFFIRPGAERAEEVVLRCDTLWIDCDRATASLSYRGIVDLQGGPLEADQATVVVASDPQGKKLRFERLRAELEREHPAIATLLGSLKHDWDEREEDPLARRYDGVITVPPPPPESEKPESEKPESEKTIAESTPTPALAPRRESVSPPALEAGQDQGAPGGMTIEHYASISAELGQKGASRSAVLERHGLSAASWTAVNRHYQRAMGTAAGEKGRELSALFDEAYLRAMTELGKSIGVDEYARILVGLERREMNKVLGELDLQLSDLMRIKRVWEKKIEMDAGLRAEVEAAAEAHRKG